MSDYIDGFETARGSQYARYPDSTTVRNRSGAKHIDKTTGIQPRSGKTVYMKPQDVQSVGGLFQNTDMATKFVPELKNGKPTGNASLILTEDYGPKKAGSVLATVPYTTAPEVGVHPVEIYKSESPIGDSGKGIHFGSKITKLLKSVPFVGGALGLATASNASEAAESLMPWWLMPSEAYAHGGKINLPDNYKTGGNTSLI